MSLYIPILLGTIALIYFLDLLVVVTMYPDYDTIGKLLLMTSLIPVILVVRKYNKHNNINGVVHS